MSDWKAPCFLVDARPGTLRSSPASRGYLQNAPSVAEVSCEPPSTSSSSRVTTRNPCAFPSKARKSARSRSEKVAIAATPSSEWKKAAMASSPA